MNVQMRVSVLGWANARTCEESQLLVPFLPRLTVLSWVSHYLSYILGF